MTCYEHNPKGIIINVWVQPRAARNLIVGRHGDALKVKLTAPPVDNAANKACVQLLAKSLKVPKSAIEIVSGHMNRRKRLLVKISEEDNHATRKKIERKLEAIF
jgi:uncharacterized protein (TIGR00251 family)